MSPERPQRRRRRNNDTVRLHTDYVDKRVRVPAAYSVLDQDNYLDTVNKWGRYRNVNGHNSYGYFIHYDEGDKY